MDAVLRSNLSLGFHITKKKNLYESFHRLADTPLTAAQIYVSSGRGWGASKATADDLRKTADYLERNGIYSCVHGKLMYNPAGAKLVKEIPQKWGLTKTGLTSELDVAAGFGAGVVVHIGTCEDREIGMANIVKTIDYVLTAETDQTKTLARELQLSDIRGRRKVILENSAGEGTKFGSSLEEIGEIIAGVDPAVKDRVKVCIDTAHIFGAGEYDLGVVGEVDRFVEEFDHHIGLDRLELFHLNDCRAGFGSRVDRHENLGLGNMFGADRGGLDGLWHLIKFAKERGIPLIGEPPAKTKEKGEAPGGFWDYGIIRGLCEIEEDAC